MIRGTASQDVIIQRKPNTRLWLKIGGPLILVTIIGVIALPSLARWSNADTSIDLARVTTGIVQRGSFTRDISMQGNIVAANSPKLYAPAVGNVTLLANPGDTVEQGQVIARVSSPSLTNRLQQEQSQLAGLEISLERKAIAAKQAKMKSRQQIQLEQVVLEAAKREMRRAEQSIKIKAISQLDYEKAIDDLKRSQLKYDFAVEQAELEKENLAFEIKTLQFERDQFKLQLKDTQRLVSSLNIIAPVTGIVGSWSVEQKSAVSLNQPLLTVVDLSAFQVELDIPEAYVDEIGIAMLAKISYNGQDYDAQVVTISPEVVNNVVKARVAFVSSPPPGIKQNQRVTSRIILEEKQNILYLPRGSFVQHHNGRKAFVIESGVATLTDITLGSRSVSKIEVLSGLVEGQEIILSNTDFVDDAKSLILN